MNSLKKELKNLYINHGYRIDFDLIWSWIIQNFIPKEEIGLPPEGTGKKPKEEVKEIEKIDRTSFFGFGGYEKDLILIEKINELVNKLNKL